MPTLRKVLPQDAMRWTSTIYNHRQPLPRERVVELLSCHAGDDWRGVTRCDYERQRPSWLVRVYSQGETFAAYFADGDYNDDPGASLAAALHWRSQARQEHQTSQHRSRTRRIIRVDRPEWKNVGYFAWRGSDGRRKYFSDARYGDSMAAFQAASAWKDS